MSVVRRELREGPPLRRLLPYEPARPLQVDVGLRMQLVPIEDHEPRLDSACA